MLRLDCPQKQGMQLYSRTSRAHCCMRQVATVAARLIRATPSAHTYALPQVSPARLLTSFCLGSISSSRTDTLGQQQAAKMSEPAAKRAKLKESSM
jgi:hypothetical protein